MNENKRLLALFIALILVVGVILIIAFWPEPDKTFSCGVKADKEFSKLGSINYKQYECLQNRDDKYVLVVSNDLSKKEKNTINKAAKKAGIGIYYLSADVSKSEIKSIKKDLKNDKVSFDKTSIVVVKKGKVEYSFDKEIKDSEDVYKLLKEAGLTKFNCGAKADAEYANLSKIDYDTYKCLYDSEEPFTLIFTQSTCGYCEQFKPVINEYAGKNNIPVYYVEVDTMDSDDSKAILSSIPYFDNNDSWGTPTTLIIKDKKSVADLGGYVDETTKLDEFFEKADLK